MKTPILFNSLTLNVINFDEKKRFMKIWKNKQPKNKFIYKSNFNLNSDIKKGLNLLITLELLCTFFNLIMNISKQSTTKQWEHNRENFILLFKFWFWWLRNNRWWFHRLRLCDWKRRTMRCWWSKKILLKWHSFTFIKIAHILIIWSQWTWTWRCGWSCTAANCMALTPIISSSIEITLPLNYDSLILFNTHVLKYYNAEIFYFMSFSWHEINSLKSLHKSGWWRRI